MLLLGAMGMHRVLVVDDSQLNRETICEVITDLGWHADAATGGLAALDQLQQEPCDAIVSDVDMPDISGFELLNRLQQAHIACPMVLMSARADASMVTAASDAGAVHLFRKPIQLGSFTSFMTQLLN